MQASIRVGPQPELQYLLRIGDTALILAQRLGEWTGHAPVLEEDIALANMALDLLGQCRAVLTHAGAIEGAGHDEDQLAFEATENSSGMLPTERHRQTLAEAQQHRQVTPILDYFRPAALLPRQLA